MQRVFFILLLLDDTHHIDGVSFNSNDFLHDFFFGLIISVIVHHGYNELSCHLGLTSLQMVLSSKSCLFFTACLGILPHYIPKHLLAFLFLFNCLVARSYLASVFSLMPDGKSLFLCCIPLFSSHHTMFFNKLVATPAKVIFTKFFKALYI